MPASEAGAWLERFAASAAPDNVCTPQGRATLRGAVRAYGRAMAEGGQVWPNIAAIGQEPNAITAVEASVMIAAASGLVEVPTCAARRAAWRCKPASHIGPPCPICTWRRGWRAATW